MTTALRYRGTLPAQEAERDLLARCPELHLVRKAEGLFATDDMEPASVAPLLPPGWSATAVSHAEVSPPKLPLHKIRHALRR